MELTTGNIFPSHLESIDKMCSEANITDRGLVFDIFRIVSSRGTTVFLTDEDILQQASKFSPEYWTRKVQINTRRDFLDHIQDSNYVKALIAMDDPLKAVAHFIEHLKLAASAEAMYHARRKSVEASTGLAVDAYGNQEDYDALVAKIAKARGEDPTFDEIMDSMIRFDQITEDEDMASFFVSACGISRFYSATTTAGGLLAKSVATMAQVLPQTFATFFHTFTALADELGSLHMKDTESLDEQARKRVERMTDYSQVDHADPVDVAGEGFDIKLAEKRLDVQHNLQQEAGVCHVFVLLDVSGSMIGTDIGGRIGRSFAANVITAALLAFAHSSRWQVHVLPFESRTGRVQSARCAADVPRLMHWLGSLNYDGVGTDIEGAVLTAYRLLASEPDYRKCDIVLVTDGFSPITQAVVKEKPERTKLRTLFLTGRMPSGYDTQKLIDASDSHALVGYDNNAGRFVLGDALAGLNQPASNDKPRMTADAGYDDEECDDE